MMLRIEAPLLPVAIALIVGIVIGEWIKAPIVVFAAMAGILIITLFLRYHPRWQTTTILICVTLFGCIIRQYQENNMKVCWPEYPAEWQAVVIDEPIEKTKTMTVDVLLANSRQKVRCHIAKSNDSQEISVGDGLILTTHIHEIRNKTSNLHHSTTRQDSNKIASDHLKQQNHSKNQNHSTFDYQRFMASRGFTGEAYVRPFDWDWGIVDISHLSRIERLRLRFMTYRSILLKHIQEWKLDKATEGVIKAMTLGDRSDLSPTVKTTYTQAGASHILALSGMHLTIIFFIINLLMNWRKAELISQAIIVTTLWAYALLVGLSPSVTRSAFMISVYALLSVGYRDSAPINTLSFTAIVMLIINPLALYDVSFQLSYVAVCAILLGNSLFRKAIPIEWLMNHRIVKWIWGITLVSLAAQIGTAPLVAYHFGVFNPCALLANFFLIPLATLTIILTIFALTTIWFPWLSDLFVMALSFVVKTMNHLLQLVTEIPYSHLNFEPFSVVLTLFIYILMGFAFILYIKYLKMHCIIK